MQVKQADTRKTSNLLKRYFKKEFGLVTKIKTSKFSMGDSLDVVYTMGADKSLVEPIINQLQRGHFNGMEDIYENTPNKESVVLEGYQLEDWKYTGVRQEVPDELLYRFAKVVSDNGSFKDVPKLESIDQFHKQFPERWGSAWDWSNLLFQYWKVRNFNTQDPEDIGEITLVEDFDSNNFVFNYVVNGVTYRTDQYVKPEVSAPNIEKVDVPEGEIQIIQYSEKAIAVIGNTKPIKDTLKGLGGRFNFRLSCGAGWIFPKTKMDELVQALS